MNTLDLIKKLCEENNTSIKALEKEMGYSNGSLAKAKVIPSDRIYEIALHFSVRMEDLMPRNRADDIVRTCPNCGISYDSTDEDEISYHIAEHSLWEKATLKFGELHCDSLINELIKAKNRNIRNNLNNPIEVRYKAELEVLRCLFSRSLQANGFSLDHCTFNEYIAMMMYGQKYRKHLDDELYKKIVDNFGTLPGIKDGDSVYRIPKQKFISKLSDKQKHSQKSSTKKQDLLCYEKTLVTYFSELSDDNKKKCITYTENLLSNQKMEEELLNAAHKRTDIEVTKEMIKHDDDIMDDENF